LERVKIKPQSALKILLILSMLLGLTIAFFSFTTGGIHFLFLGLFLTATPLIALLYLRRRKAPGKLDLQLVILVTHMYCLSIGNVETKKLFKAVASNREYERYSRIFQSILDVATRFGYGFAKAANLIASSLKPPIKDVLVRVSDAVFSKRPGEYLELEAYTLLEEYSGEYSRVIESIKVIGGVYSSILSVTSLALMVSSLMTIFVENPYMPLLSSLAAFTSMAVIVFGLKVLIPSEKTVYTGENPPRYYRLFKLTVLMMVASLPLPLLLPLLGGYDAIPYSLLFAGGLALIPGFMAYRFESWVNELDKYYPTFLKTLGENLSSTSSFTSALSYLLYMELGPLKRLVKRALARLKLGVDLEKTMQLLASEAASHQIYVFNRIFVESFRAGSQPLKVGKVLGNLVIRLLELRNRRRVVSRSFEVVVLVLQPIIVALLIILMTLSAFFSQLVTSLPFFALGRIPLELIKYEIIFVVVFTVIINSVSITIIRGGYRGMLLAYLGILLIESGLAWIGAYKLMEVLFTQFAGGFQIPV